MCKSILKRRDFIRAMGLSSLSLTGFQCLQNQNRRQNVLFIAVDDLRTQLDVYGHSVMHTPNIDKLAQQGTLFKRAYCQYPLCCPSRTSIMTGLRPDTVRVYNNDTHFRDTHPNIVTLSQHFKNNDYYTWGIGKLYHHTKAMQDEQSWTEGPVDYFSNPIKDEYLKTENREGYIKAEQIAQSAGLTDWDLHTASLQGAPPYEAADVPDDAYPDGKIANQAIQKIKDRANKNQPFFIGVGFHKPHLSFNCPQKYWDLYDREEITQAENPNIPEKYPQGYYYNSNYIRHFKGMPQTGPFPEETAKTLRHAYFACVSYVDAQVGKLLDSLAELGIRQNTIICLWGDHGYLLNDHGIFGKHNTFENAVLAPCIISSPDLPNGQQTHGLVEFVDIYPSLCELAGLSLPGHLEGKSVVPLVKNPNAPGKREVVSQYPAKGTMGYSIRTARYRYTEWIDRKTSNVAAKALFDYDKDPYETKNLVNESDYEQIQKELSFTLGTKIKYF